MQLGIAGICALLALWIVYRIERKPDVLPPPDRSVTTRFKFYIARWTRAHGDFYASANHKSH